MIKEQALKDRLKAIAKEKSMHFNACWKQLLLERFLVRIASSEFCNQFVFKGGFLLSYLLEIGRETTDLDFLLLKLSAEEENLRRVFSEIAEQSNEDGFSFFLDGMRTLNQPHMNYPGCRLSLRLEFGDMRDQVQVDIGVGDQVVPATRELQLMHYRGEPIFEKSVSMSIYTPEMVFAEKFEAVLSKGAQNTRMKDYHDLLLLHRQGEQLDLDMLRRALEVVFENRGVAFRMIVFRDRELETLEKLWSQHLNGLGTVAAQLALPHSIAKVIDEINSRIRNVFQHQFS